VDTIRIASVQFEHKDGDKDFNLKKIESFVKTASQQNVQMIAFPECSITGYWFLRKLSREELECLAEPAFKGFSSQKLMQFSNLYNMTIGAGLIEIDDKGILYNTYVVAMPDGCFQRHRKIHCFINENISSGEEYTVFDTPYGCKVGVLICYDNNLIENARMTALKGAEILLAPHQTGGCLSPSPHCMGLIDKKLWEERKKNPQAIEAEFRGHKGREWLLTWLPARAHDNGMFLVFSNGVGIDDNEVRTGNAMILDPYGRIICETWKAQDDMVVADIDMSLRDDCTGVRWIRGRKPELYSDLAKSTGKEEDIRTVRFKGLPTN